MSILGRLYVVVVSYRRPEILRKSLDSLQALDRFDWQLSLAINGPDPDSEAATAAWISAHPHPKVDFQKLRLPQDLASSRNLLLAKIHPHLQQKDWVLFLDDDAFLPEDYGQRLNEALKLAESVGAKIIGGPNLTPPGSGLFSRLSGEWLASRWVSGPMSLRYRQGPAKIVKNDDGLILCQLLVSGQILRSDLFLHRIWGGEENLMFAQYFSGGGRAVYDGQLICFHERRPTLSVFLRQIRKYGQGRGQVMIVTGQARWAHVLPIVIIIMILGLWWGPFLPFVRLLVGLEFFISIAVSISICWKEKALAGFLSVLVIPLVHMSYAVGVTEGIFRGPPDKSKHKS